MRNEWETHPAVTLSPKKTPLRYRWRLHIYYPQRRQNGESYAKNKADASRLARLFQGTGKENIEITLTREAHSGELSEEPQCMKDAHRSASVGWPFNQEMTFKVWREIQAYEWKENDWQAIRETLQEPATEKRKKKQEPREAIQKKVDRTHARGAHARDND